MSPMLGLSPCLTPYPALPDGPLSMVHLCRPGTVSTVDCQLCCLPLHGCRAPTSKCLCQKVEKNCGTPEEFLHPFQRLLAILTGPQFFWFPKGYQFWTQSKFLVACYNVLFLEEGYVQSDRPIGVSWTCGPWLLPLLRSFSLIYSTAICCG